MHRSWYRNPVQTHRLEYACFQRFASHPKLVAIHFRFHAKYDRVRTGTLPAEKEQIFIWLKVKISLKNRWTVRFSSNIVIGALLKYKKLQQKPKLRRHQFTWIRMEIIIPNMVTSRIGTNINQMNDEIKSEQSHKNAAATNIIIRMGSWAMVIENMANAGPKARKAQPKNSGKVMFGRSIECQMLLINIKRNVV